MSVRYVFRESPVAVRGLAYFADGKPPFASPLEVGDKLCAGNGAADDTVKRSGGKCRRQELKNRVEP